MGTGTGDEGESREENEEDDDEQVDFGYRVNLNSSIQENEAYTDRGTGTMDQFGVVRTISKTSNTSGQSGYFVTMTNSEMRTEEIKNTGKGNAPTDREVNNEKTSRQRIKSRISTSTNLPGIDRVTQPLVTPLVDNGASIEEALTNIVGSIGEQNEQMSIGKSELERAVHVERERLRKKSTATDKKLVEAKNDSRKERMNDWRRTCRE